MNNFCAYSRLRVHVGNIHDLFMLGRWGLYTILSAQFVGQFSINLRAAHAETGVLHGLSRFSRSRCSLIQPHPMRERTVSSLKQVSVSHSQNYSTCFCHSTIPLDETEGIFQWWEWSWSAPNSLRQFSILSSRLDELCEQLLQPYQGGCSLCWCRCLKYEWMGRSHWSKLFVISFDCTWSSPGEYGTNVINTYAETFDLYQIMIL